MLIMNLMLDFSFKRNSQMHRGKTNEIRFKENTSITVICKDYRPQQSLMPNFFRSDFHTK